MKFFILLILLALSACGEKPSSSIESKSASVAALEEVKQTPAYALAVAEAGKELDPLDPRVERTALILFDAAKFFNTTEKEVSNVAYYHAKAARAHGAQVTANEILLAGMKAFPPDSPKGKPDLKSFNFFGAMYQASAKSASISSAPSGL